MHNTEPFLLCLDFDGVLHPSTAVEDFVASGLPLTAYAQSRPHLLSWAPLLEAALAGTSCEVLVHSSWRNLACDPELRAFLEPSGLAHRFIGGAPRDKRRETAILEVASLMDLPHARLLILDDAIAEYGQLLERVVECNPLLGISEQSVLERVRDWARAM